MSKLATLSTTKKVIGSLALAGTAAAVAGLGTFGTFTDSTAPLNTTVASGTVDINLAQPSGAIAVPVSTTGFVPGDSITRAVNLSNDGNSALASVSLASTATAGSILTTDIAVSSVGSITTSGSAVNSTVSYGGTQIGTIARVQIGRVMPATPASCPPAPGRHRVVVRG